jgi:DNA mismatch repair protein MutS2
MQPGALRALEFDRIVEAVKAFALTPMGADRLGHLTPSVDPQKVAQLLAATSETTRYISAHGVFPLRGSTDLPQMLAALAIEGRALEALRLLALATFLDSIDEARTAIRRAPGSFPMLEGASGAAASFKGETAQVRDKIDPSGDVVDDASAALKLIRDRLRKQRTRLRTTLESYLRGKETAKYLQEQVVTERNGRYVLVVKTEQRGGIPGIVHGTSTSGASLYLEPLSTVEINNDIVALEEQETEEVRRILLALTDAFRARAVDLARTIDVAIDLDILQARAQFSNSVDGIEPVLSADGTFELQAARHPLVKNAVPVTIKVIPPATVLLITGPNTGGKTVALKTAGLFSLMAQSGLRIPAADGSRLPIFRSLFADIGDEQSIEANLSTFSAHITNIASMDRALVTPALVLLDEVGSGTDPIEGGALGVAMVDHFRKRGATVIATSHYDSLKTYASTTEGVTSAAFGFDPETFAPTYRLMYGTPGRSLALEIAGRIGLNPSVIAAARENITAREAQLAEHLAKIDHDMRALEHEHRLVSRERETLEAQDARMRQREEVLRQREETYRRRLGEELDAQVRQARREIDAQREDRRDGAGGGAAGRLHRRNGRGARRRAGGRRKRREEGAPARAGIPSVHGDSDGQRSRALGRRPRHRRRARARGRRHGSSRRDGGARRPRQADARERSRPAHRRRRRSRGDGENQGECGAAAARDLGSGFERHRLHRRRSHRARRTVSRRVAPYGSARRSPDPRVRHGPVEAGARRLPPAASARRTLRHGPAGTGRRRRHRGGAEGLVGELAHS